MCCSPCPSHLQDSMKPTSAHPRVHRAEDRSLAQNLKTQSRSISFLGATRTFFSIMPFLGSGLHQTNMCEMDMHVRDKPVSDYAIFSCFFDFLLFFCAARTFFFMLIFTKISESSQGNQGKTSNPHTTIKCTCRNPRCARNETNECSPCPSHLRRSRWPIPS